MEREKIYNALFKCNSKNEEKFSSFSQLNPIGEKTIVYIVINLAIGGSQVKNNVKWLREKNIISNSKSDENLRVAYIGHLDT